MYTYIYTYLVQIRIHTLYMIQQLEYTRITIIRITPIEKRDGHPLVQVGITNRD
jgi:hypothetical protein